MPWRDRSRAAELSSRVTVARHERVDPRSALHEPRRDAASAQPVRTRALVTGTRVASLERMLKLAIIIGSTRPGRVGEGVARWVHQIASKRKDASFELVDVASLGLPLLDEAKPPAMGHYANDHTKAWAAKVASFDGFLFVTAEYNHGIPAALKNALDFVYAEWNDKAAGFVSYGSAGGTRAVEHLRAVMAELQIADVRLQVTFSVYTDFEKGAFRPKNAEQKEQQLHKMLDQLLKWTAAMKMVRGGKLDELASAAE